VTLVTHMSDKIYLSVIIPSYNETANLKRGVLSEVNTYLARQKYSWEVIISDDGSPEEESRQLARDFCDKTSNFIYLQNEHGGKAFAVYTGVQKSSGELVLFTDMDQSTPISELEKILPQFDRGFDIVIGSRGEESQDSPLLRLVAHKVFLTFRRIFLLGNFVDTQAGFKAFRGPVIKEIFPILQAVQSPPDKKSGWNPTAFDVELLVAAQARGYKVTDVPIKWQDRDISTGKSRGLVKFARESLEMLHEVFRVKANDLSGHYRK